MQDHMTPHQFYRDSGYFLCKGFVPRFFSDYLKQVLHTNHLNTELGTLYGDPAFDTFCMMSSSLIANIAGASVSPMYSQCRIYRNDDYLLPEKKPEHFEHSAIVFLGGTYESLWPVWLQKPEVHKTPQLVALEEGDCVIYKADEVYMWRDHFEGTDYYELSMHYVESEGSHKDFIYDKRPYIGLPKSDHDEPRECEQPGEDTV